MSEEKLLTVRDVSSILGITEKEVMDLAESGAIPAYKVGGVFVRFKKEQVDDYKRTHWQAQAKTDASSHNPFKDKVSDFFYFNDFYIAVSLIIILLLVIIFRK